METIEYKSPEAATKPNAGNDVNTPADKAVVKDPANLTPEEKKAIEDKVKAVNPDATVVVDDKGNATVTTPEGKTAVIPAADLTKSPEEAAKPNAGNDVNKPADKTAVKDPANLTPEEKKAIEDKVKAVNPDATVVVDDKGNATVTTPEGKTAVIPAADLTKSPEAATKPNAGNDIVKPADKTVVKDPANLTPEEKKAIEDKVKAVNPDATVVVDDKGNATVTTPEGKTAVIPAADLTKSPEEAAKPNAGNDVNKPADKTAVKDPANLTPEEKKAIEDKVKAVNPDATVVVDDKGNATVTTPEGKTAVIPAADLTKSPEAATKPNAGNDIVKPADKTVVKDPANLTPEEKKAIEDKVKAVNPDATVVVDDKGNATVTTPEGKTATIPAADLTKSAADAGKENAGNAVNTPAAKVEVKDPAKLTDEEKAKVKKAVEDVNPGSTVVVTDKGDVIVTKGDGTVLVIPELDLVIPEDKLTDPTQQNGVNTPATRVLVGDKAKLTADEIEKVKESIKAVNPGATVVVDENGNATVTTEDGKTATIPAAQLVKDAKDVATKNNGENINVDFEKETVADFNNLTDAEKEAAKAKIKGANADVVEVIFDKAGNATVITKDGKVYTIVAKDIFRQRPYVPSNGGGNNGATNTDAKVDKAKLEGAIRQLDELIVKESAKLDAETAKEANALSADAKKVFANADASQAEVDAMVKRIEGFMAKVASSTDHATPANDQAAQTPAVDTATTQAASNASQTASAQANARKVAKELPNTGTADSTVAMVAAAASALLGLGLAGRRRKDDEEA
ncbi:MULTISPECIES: LPXTG cell wall anchor domain-containing protein [Streptococcus]|uniref:LPXTG cell wall anchor domain-containing protein n=1 Tax=Streptococcus TaxID=1301 RepID=UPI001E656487|nr:MULTISPECIES: LPXTG cell wall anchor domain-containing protein [Streptococcus]